MGSKGYVGSICGIHPGTEANHNSPYVEVDLLQSPYEFSGACLHLQHWAHHAGSVAEHENSWIRSTTFVWYVRNLKVRADQHFMSLQLRGASISVYGWEG